MTSCQPKVKSTPKQVKPAPKPKVKKEKAKSAPKAEVKEQVKPASKPKVKTQKPKKEKAKSAQPAQLALDLAPPAEKKKAKVRATKPKPKEEAKPVKAEAAAPVAASKEEKAKAVKVIRQLEKSDAYQLYKRNGKRSQIGEFDFRDMLFTTMESSAETLKRNVDLFKRYAEILFRTDLIAFLEFCEEYFAALLTPKVKTSLRKK